MLIEKALALLLSDQTLEGQLYEGKWLEYKLSDDGTQILRQNEPIRLEDLVLIEWRLPIKTTDQ
jgi:hypothetical protein